MVGESEGEPSEFTAARGPGGYQGGTLGDTGFGLQEADTDDHQGTLGFEEFCAFYKMMSTRRDLYLLMLTYSDHKDHLNATDLQRFLEVEQKVRAWGKRSRVPAYVAPRALEPVQCGREPFSVEGWSIAGIQGP